MGIFAGAGAGRAEAQEPSAPRSEDVAPKKKPEPPSAGTKKEEEKKPESEAERRLKSRIAPGKLEVDITVAGSVRGWEPQRYPTLDVEVTPLATFLLDVRANVFDLVHLHRLYYEASGLVAPRGELSGVAADASEAVNTAAYLVGMLGVSIPEALGIGDKWELFVKYEAFSLSSTARPTEPIYYMPHDFSPHAELPARTERPITLVTTFETLVFGGLRSANGPQGGVAGSQLKEPDMYIGLGLASYAKPYMMRFEDKYLADFLFDTRFRGIGLALGTKTPPAPNRPFWDLAGQIGAGEVELLEEFEVSKQLKEGLGVAYLLGMLQAGFFFELYGGPPSILLGATGSVGGTYFYVYDQESSDSGGSSSSSSSSDSTKLLNWDVFWSASPQLVLTM